MSEIDKALEALGRVWSNKKQKIAIMHCFECTDYNCCDSVGFEKDIQIIRQTLEQMKLAEGELTAAYMAGAERGKKTVDLDSLVKDEWRSETMTEARINKGYNQALEDLKQHKGSIIGC